MQFKILSYFENFAGIVIPPSTSSSFRVLQPATKNTKIKNTSKLSTRMVRASIGYGFLFVDLSKASLLTLRPF